MGLWCRARDALESPLLYAAVKWEQALESETAAGKISNLNLIAILWGIFKWPTIIFIPVLYSIACLRMWDKAPIKLLWLHFQVHQWGNECDWCAQYDCGARIIPVHMGKKKREMRKHGVWMMVLVFERFYHLMWRVIAAFQWFLKTCLWDICPIGSCSIFTFCDSSMLIQRKIHSATLD